MNRIHTVAAILLLALWAPVTAHCRLETLPGFEFLQCAGDSEQDCGGDACQTVESGDYRVQHNTEVLPLSALTFLTPVLLDHSLVGGRPVLREHCPDTSPPELPASWRFLCRAALPPRAPSCVS